MPAKKIMIQSTGFGTGSGKSLIVALLCRIFKKQGVRVAPFKTLNLTSLTYQKGDREFGFSQVLQAEASGIESDYRMNPLTIKPLGNGKFDIFIQGKVREKNYTPGKDFLTNLLKGFFVKNVTPSDMKNKILETLKELSKEYDLIIVEGTGGSKIFGLASFSSLLDMGNMGIAEGAALPTLFVTDNIDSVPQTISYMKKEEKRLIKGVILNNIPVHEFSRVGISKKWLDLALRNIKRVYAKEIDLQILGTLPHFEEIEDLPDLDPIAPGKKALFTDWKERIDSLSRKAEKYLDVKGIYNIACE